MAIYRLFMRCSVLMLLVSACLPVVQSRSLQGENQIIYGLTLQPSGFDPHIYQSSELGIPMRQVYDTLVYRDPNTNEFVPGLATQWSISEDGLSYTFSLRQGVTFHDSTVFNAQAVGANLDRITNPETGSQKAIFMLGPYVNYEIIDDYTLRINLSEPYSPLLDSLSQVYLGIASPTAFSQYTVSTYQFHQVGTGPFMMADYIPGERIVLRRNPAYTWGPAFFNPVSENAVEEITFLFFTDPPTRSLAVESGQAQVIGELLPTDASALTGNSAVQLIPASIPGQPLQFLMNTSRFPTDSKLFRQAVLYGSNRNAIIDAVYQRFSPVAWGPLSASTPFYDAGMAGLYSHDTAQAQTLLANAGFNDADGNGYLDSGTGNLQINVIVPPWGLIPEVAQLLQDQWRVIGIEAVLDPVPSFNALRERVDAGEYNMVAFYTFGADPSLLNNFFMSGGIQNWLNYANNDLDTFLRDAARTSDFNTRRVLYANAQRLIMEDALILPIRDYVNLNAAAKGIYGLTFDAYGWFPLLHNMSINPTEGG